MVNTVGKLLLLPTMRNQKGETQQDTSDAKKHWIKNLSNNMKKPTGWTGENRD
jgi:hypothetical protein